MIHPTIIALSILFLSSTTEGNNNNVTTIATKNSTMWMEYYFCQNGLQSDTTLILLPSTNHTVSFDKFCMVQNVTNVTIRGSTGHVLISCIGKGSGFGFFNTTNLHIENLSFIGCGNEIQLPPNVKQFTNESDIYMGPGQKAVLLFTHCHNTRLISVTITGQYKGIGVLSINGYGNATTVSNVSVTRKAICQNAVSLSDFSCAGGGIVFVYIETEMSLKIRNVKLTISNSKFARNTQLFMTYTNIADFFSPSYPQSPILCSSGITLIISSNKHALNVSFHQIKIFNNYNTHIGAMLVVYHRTLLAHNIVMTGLNITENYLIPYNGRNAISAGLSFLVSGQKKAIAINRVSSSHSTITITESTFLSNYATRGVAMLYLAQPYSYVNVDVHIKNCTFFHNSVTVSGSAMYIEMSKIKYKDSPPSILNILLSEVQATDNKFWSSNFENDKQYHYGVPVFSFNDITKVTVNDCQVFNNNGSAIQVYNTILEMQNNFRCENNTSINGGCLQLQGLSLLQLTETTNAVFIGNKALVSGGAIYGNILGIHTDVCTIQPYAGISKFKYPFVFESNRAHLDGDDVKITNIYDCLLLFNKTLQEQILKKDFTFYRKLFHLQNNHSNSISGKEYVIEICKNARPKVSYFSGQTVVLPTSVLDRARQPVSAQILATINTFSTYSIQLTSEAYHSLYPTDCNILNFTMTTKANYPISGQLWLQGTFNMKAYFAFDFQILPCPIGFAISETNKHACTCSPFLKNLKSEIVCDIDKAVVQLPPMSWFGKGVKYNSSEAYSSICPPDYCSIGHTTSYNATLPDPLCKYNRTDVMCGQCQPGLSQVFGSFECIECSNLWILTVIGYMVVGIVIVLLLFYMKLTIASSLLGGIIFFANLSAVSLHMNLLSSNPYTFPVRILMAALNLNIGYSVCFYNSMDTVTKTAMQFAFPMYLWLIVLALVVTSRYSVRISNLIVGSSVQVLVTLIHFSFAKLLMTICDVFTSAEIQYLNSNNGLSYKLLVWYFDGNERYIAGRHFPLFCASIVTLIVFILPYLCFTMVVFRIGRLSRCLWINRRLGPFIDTFCGPYKSKYRYWFSVRLWIVTLLYVAYATLRGIHPQILLILNIIVTFLFMSLQVYIKPFNSQIANVMDSLFIYLLCITDIVTYFFVKDNNIGSNGSSIVITLLLMVYLMIVGTVFLAYFLLAGTRTQRMLMRCFNFFKGKMTAEGTVGDDAEHQRLYRYETGPEDGVSLEHN